MSLRAVRDSAVYAVTTEECGQVTSPSAKLSRCGSRRIVLRVLEDTEDFVREIFSDRASHASESIHEKIDGVLPVEVER